MTTEVDVENKIDIKVNSSDNDEDNEIKHCWLCFQTTEDENDDEWVRPCRCKGTSKWIHQQCLQRWIDEKQKHNFSKKVTCSQCKTEYLISFPRSHRFVIFLEICDRLIYATSPFLCGTMVVGFIYWSALSYGAVTVMQVLGVEEAKVTIEERDPFMVFLGLPSIPLMLILGKLIKWEDHVLNLWRKYYKNIPFIGNLFGVSSDKIVKNTQRQANLNETLIDYTSSPRLFCGALLLPTLSTLIGKYLYPRVTSNLWRALLGGLTFILGKGILKIYLRQKQFIRQCNRKVLNFKESDNNKTSTTVKPSTSTSTENA